MNRLKAYLQATRGELEHVSWPSKQQAAVTTVLVVAVVLATSLFLAIFDFIFSDMIVENIITDGFNFFSR